MLDTIMILWARGIYKQFFLALLAFLVLFTGVCIVMLTLTSEGVRWPGEAIALASPTVAIPTQTAITSPSPTPATKLVSALFPTIPVISQNPASASVTASVTSTPTTIVTPTASISAGPSQQAASAPPSSSASTLPPSSTRASLTPAPTHTPRSAGKSSSSTPSNRQPTLFPTIPYPSSPWSAFQGPVPGNTLLNSANHSSSKVMFLQLQTIFWQAFVAALLLLLLAFLLIILYYKKQRAS